MRAAGGKKEMIYCNPILRGFHPDPSICRVDKDYYLVVSSFEYFPGIPVYHSRDLVNWTHIGNCIRRADEFPYENAKDSGGVWAPTIRYNDGYFYVTATFDGCGNFIIRAKDPAGEWSRPVWVREVGGIDPSLYFENGHAYYCTNERLDGKDMISMQEIDIESGKITGERRCVWRGIGGGYIEAPHIYRIGDWYYLLVAEGGTFYNHMANIARSGDLWGPYESCPNNPILTNMCDPTRQVQCSGHADLIDDGEGGWWAVHLGTRLARRTMTHLGRETFLTPVVWKDGWPMCGHDRKTVLLEEGPISARQEPVKGFAADMEKTEWEPEWIFLRNPDMQKYRRMDGNIILSPSVDTMDGKRPTFAAVRPIDFDCVTDAVFDFSNCRPGDEAGLAVRLESSYYITCVCGIGDSGRELRLTLRAEDIRHEVAAATIPDGRINLRMSADKEKYTFAYSVDNNRFEVLGSVSTRFVSIDIAGRCFTGTVIGLYTSSEEQSGAEMTVYKFEILPSA